MAGSSTRSTQLQQWSLSPVFPRGVLNTLRPRQYCRHFTDDIFKCIFMNENVWILIKISLKYVPKVRINNIPALVQIMAWCRLGDKPLSEQMMVCFTDIYASPGLNELIIGDIETEMYLEKLPPPEHIFYTISFATNTRTLAIFPHYINSQTLLSIRNIGVCWFETFPVFLRVRHRRPTRWNLNFIVSMKFSLLSAPKVTSGSACDGNVINIMEFPL